MRRARPALLLTGALLLLVSLYLPWQGTTCGSSCSGGFSSPGTLFGGSTLDGWSTDIGSGAALFALALLGASAAALLRPELAGRFAVRRCAVCAGYLFVAVGVEARSTERLQASRLEDTHAHFAYGAYVGGIGVALAVVAAAAGRRPQLGRLASPGQVALATSAATLLVGLLLPWWTQGSSHVTRLGVETPEGLIVAVLAICAVAAAGRRERLLLTTGTALFTLAEYSSLNVAGAHRYGGWVALGAAGAMLVVAAVGARPLPSLPRASPVAFASGGAAALVLVALFLPWQDECFAASGGFGPYSGRCLATNAWISLLGGPAGLLAVGLVVLALSPRWRAGLTVAGALGLALLVATLAVDIADMDSEGVRAGYGAGSKLGVAAAALLLVLTAARLGRPAVDRSRLVNRLAPILACVGYLAVVVLPWWVVLPAGLQSALRFSSFSWMTVAGALAAVWLVCVWAEGAGDGGSTGKLVMLLPAGMVALATLDLIRVRDGGITWGRGVIPALALVLLVFGWIEERGGLESFQVPEILRLDRL